MRRKAGNNRIGMHKLYEYIDIVIAQNPASRKKFTVNRQKSLRAKRQKEKEREIYVYI